MRLTLTCAHRYVSGNKIASVPNVGSLPLLSALYDELTGCLIARVSTVCRDVSNNVVTYVAADALSNCTGLDTLYVNLVCATDADMRRHRDLRNNALTMLTSLGALRSLQYLFVHVPSSCV